MKTKWNSFLFTYSYILFSLSAIYKRPRLHSCPNFGSNLGTYYKQDKINNQLEKY